MTTKQSAFPVAFPRDAAILDPARRVIAETPSWIEHIPFAFWIVGSTEPQLIVELGTHYGNSYFAMAQAVQDRALATSMFAIDTWEGDEHSGRYGEEVFSSVSGHNAANYAGFSTLLRATFDQAVERFEEGEIDLLHIDGFHTYEAVSQDFETWLPKLSARGVALFHDIAVRERDFGVHRFWRELEDRYPTFGFDHGHGLGAAGIGPEVPEATRRLLDLEPDSPAAVAVRRLFFVLGQRIALESTESARIKAANVKRDAEFADLRSEHAAEMAELRASADREVEAARMEVELADARAADTFNERLDSIIKAEP